MLIFFCLQDIGDTLDAIAHAINLMATGPDSLSREPRVHSGIMMEGDSPEMSLDDNHNAVENMPSQVKQGVDDNRRHKMKKVAGRPLSQLTNLIDRGDIHHKMDAFDVDALNQLVRNSRTLKHLSSGSYEFTQIVTLNHVDFATVN